LKEARETMDMYGMMDRCVDAMSSMMGSGTMFVVLMVLLLVWLIGLGVVGALVFWGVRRLSETRA
jgi:low affinity Fe/Cu permease